MMNKYLILNFKNAKLFTNSKPKDNIIEFGSYTKREHGLKFIEPITKYQIGNMLSVLFGERPKSSIRKIMYPTTDYYFKMAEKSYLKINNVKSDNKRNFGLITEKSSTKKSGWNSWNPSIYINWEIIRNYSNDDETFKWLVTEINNLVEFDSSLIPFKDVVTKLKTLDLSTFIDKLRNKQMSALVSYIVNDISNELTRKEGKTAITITNGIEDVVKLNGEIIIPINDDDIIKLNSSKGCATILDNGFVWVIGLKNEGELVNYDFDEFRLVSEISTETNY